MAGIEMVKERTSDEILKKIAIFEKELFLLRCELTEAIAIENELLDLEDAISRPLCEERKMAAM